MNNPLVSMIMGKVDESDVVPVPGGALTTSTYRNRLAKLRQRRGEDEDGNVISGDLSGVLGESAGDVIPDDAEELDTSNIQGNITARLSTIKDTVEEPGRPRDPDEIFISPKAALTAPDATPDSAVQLDPSKIPGVEKSSFTVPQIETAPEQAQTEMPQTGDGSDGATNTMDLILGRKRVGNPAKKAEDFAMTGAVTTEAKTSSMTEAQAQAMLGIGKSGNTLLGQGQAMPAPANTNAAAIYEAARRWTT